jgi:Pentapeptide repeats (8 copies)
VIGKRNRPESEISRRIEAVRSSGETSFRGLLAAGGFDLSTDLRFQNLSGLSFAREDLRGIDFTGANLVACDFDAALIEGARFDRARLGMTRLGAQDSVRLSDALDWPAHVRNWVPADNDADYGDDHLPTGSLFQDAPYLPMMVMVRSHTLPRVDGNYLQIAISASPIRKPEFQVYEDRQKNARVWIEDPGYADVGDSQNFKTVPWEAVSNYSSWASQEVQRRYRSLREEEWKIFLLTIARDVKIIGAGDPNVLPRTNLGNSVEFFMQWFEERKAGASTMPPAPVPGFENASTMGEGHASFRVAREVGARMKVKS